jgi:hypothetical protein
MISDSARNPTNSVGERANPLILTYAIQESENDKYVRGLMFDRLGIPRNASTESVFDVKPHPYAMTAERLDERLRRA